MPHLFHGDFFEFPYSFFVDIDLTQSLNSPKNLVGFFDCIFGN